jgi:hypothetical protein
MIARLLALLLAVDGGGGGGGGTPCERLAEARQMKPGHRELDVNADGVPDCVLKGCYSRDCDTEIYVIERGSPRRVGQFISSVVGEPTCISSPTDGGFCRLSVGVMMIHGEDQKYWYDYIDGGYVETGVGQRVPGPGKRR